MGFSGGMAAFSEAAQEAPVKPQPPFSKFFPLHGDLYEPVSFFMRLDFISPLSPSRPFFPGEQFQVWSGAAMLDDRVKLIRFSGMLSFSAYNDIHLFPARS
jgi:hypothetical protein